ncbi:hypothetical protein SLA2020_469470 [Shorea laevis]
MVGGVSRKQTKPKTTWRTPYIMRLAFSASVGGLPFGYDTGVIAGALLYIREEFHVVDRKTWTQVKTIVSMAVAGAIIGAAIGGWANERFGRKLSIMAADVLFFCWCNAFPDRIRDALVNTNGFLITSGQFLSYFINLALTKTPGTWRWML